MIGKDPVTQDVHVNLENDVEILHTENLIIFMNADEKKNGGGKVFIRIDNERDLELMAEAINRSRVNLKRAAIKRKKEQYISFSGQTVFEVQKIPTQ